MKKQEIKSKLTKKDVNPKQVAIIQEIYSLKNGRFRKEDYCLSDMIINHEPAFSEEEIEIFYEKMNPIEVLEAREWSNLIKKTQRRDLIGNMFFMEVVDSLYKYNLNIFNEEFNRDEEIEQMATSFSYFARLLILILIVQIALSNAFEDDLLVIKNLKRLNSMKDNRVENIKKQKVITLKSNIINGFMENLLMNIDSFIEEQLKILKHYHYFCFKDFLYIESLKRSVVKKIKKYYFFPKINKETSLEGQRP